MRDYISSPGREGSISFSAVDDMDTQLVYHLPTSSNHILALHIREA